MVAVDVDPNGTHILIESDWRHKELCKSLPGASWDKDDRVWRVPLSWTSCLALRSTFPNELVIKPSLEAWAFHELDTRITPSLALRDLEDAPGDEDLFPHQRAGVRFLTTARRALLADEMGLGKTAQAIRALVDLEKQGEQVYPTLVVCPNTLKRNWEREFAKWAPGVRTQVVKGTALRRRKLLEDPEVDVYIMNWEALRSHSRLAPYGSVALVRCPACGGLDERVTAARCEVHEGELNRMKFRAVIADEIHRSKDPKSKQTRALWAATGDADIRFAMTGTPIANDVLDLWSILHWLSPEDWPAKTKWRERMVDSMMNAFGGLVVLGVKPHMKEEFYKGVNPRMRRMLKARVLPFLPEIIKERRDTEMSAKQERAYNEMRDHMIAELENGDALTALSPLTQTLRLLQFASSYADVETVIEMDENGEPQERQIVTLAEPSCKVDQLMDDIKNGDYGDDSVAVCAVSRQLIDMLSAAMTKAKIPHGLITGTVSEDDRQKAVEDFQAGRIKWILFTAQAGGVGITLTAARQMVMLQRPWSLVDYKQAMDRVHRIGSEIHDSILITDYVTDGSIEERVLQALDTKADNFEEVVRDRDQLLSILKDDKAGRL